MDDRETSGSRTSGLFGRTLGQIDRVREAVVRSSQIGKIKLDATFRRRDRDQLVLRLGEEALNLMLTDRLAIPEELSALVKEIEGLERRIEADGKQVDEILQEGLGIAR